jgi:hypothetical protein
LGHPDAQPILTSKLKTGEQRKNSMVAPAKTSRHIHREGRKISAPFGGPGFSPAVTKVLEPGFGR